MRLLHSTTWKFQDFFDSSIPAYAILSHRWGIDGVSYPLLQFAISKAKPTRPFHLSGDGFRKILKCREQAASDDYECVWVDTCCINKESGAELSEAINSIYRWYRQAGVCYNYLDDVDCDSFGVKDERQKVRFNPHWVGLLESVKKSEWSTRGWTLQELLAPRNSHFYDKHWVFVARRDYIAEAISQATGIETDSLTGDAFLLRGLNKIDLCSKEDELAGPEEN
jgi:Heterokaryon incompatibility protein (HET)